MAAQELKISIPEPRLKLMNVKIKGLTPLICHKWSDKAKKQILDKQLKKAQKGREIRDPKAEYKDSFYYNSEDKIAFPARCIKSAIVGAARNLDGVAMTMIRGAVFVLGDKDDFIRIKYGKKKMREDMVRVQRGGADIRFRGQLNDWEMEFVIRFNEAVLSAEQVLHLLQIAGFSCGIGEWRPQKSGNFGTFEVVST